jgi:hypothetical protein
MSISITLSEKIDLFGATDSALFKLPHSHLHFLERALHMILKDPTSLRVGNAFFQKKERK